jgi:HKD family nuclease
MATKEFILQGLTDRTHMAAVRELFDVPNIERVILSVAFITEGGVDLLSAKIKSCASHVEVFAGIRNDITSRQGLTRLHALGVNLYAVDTGSRNVLFHPKLYLVRGKRRARLMIGSANLTIGGLNNNIEAGMLLEFDLTEKSDKSVVDTIEGRFSVLPKEYPAHVLKIDTTKLLDEMQASGRLVDEMALPPPRPSTSASSGSSDPVSRITLKVVPIRKSLGKPKAPTKPITKPPTKKAAASTPAPSALPTTVGVEFDLLWESKPLTRRDLTIPTASGTHATGSVNLDKGLLGEEIDHRHYFRDAVFEHLTWSTTISGTVDEAYAKFQLVLKAVSYGEFDLRIAHTTSTTTTSYAQRNAMTRLSWGPMRPFIAKPDLIGRTLALYRDRVDATRFILEID